MAFGNGLVEGDILDAARLGRCEIVLAGITAIGDLPRRHAATGDLALEHWQEALGIGRGCRPRRRHRGSSRCGR
jgi:hypothetical protein